MPTSLQSSLLYLADPQIALRSIPPKLLPAQQLELLRDLANRHNVLPAVFQNLAALHRQNQLPTLLSGTPAEITAAYDAFAPAATRRIAQLAAMSLFLRQQALQLLRAFTAAHIPAIVVKGPAFAQQLYTPPALRPFIDIDLLIPAAHWNQIPDLMDSLHFLPHDSAMKYSQGYGEQAYTHRDFPGCSIEIHWNLVNSPTLRHGIFVTYEQLQLDSNTPLFPPPHLPLGPTLTPASLLLIATVHAAASHGYDKLQHLCDILQIIRQSAGPLDIDYLQKILPATGATRALATGLHLTAQAFHEPRCTRLLHALHLHPPSLLKNLITPAMVLRGQTPQRTRDSWRRQLFRQLLKRRNPKLAPSSPPPQPAPDTHTTPSPAP